MSGPAAAIRISRIGSSTSRSICATPPNMKRVMRLIGSPARTATMEWLNSCRRIEVKRRIAVKKPISHRPGGEKRPG